MTPLTRRSFLQALGLSIPAVAAAKYLPADTVPVAKPDQTISLEDFKSEPKTYPLKSGGNGLWINGIEYNCESMEVEHPRSTSIDVTSFDSEYSPFTRDPATAVIRISGNHDEIRRAITQHEDVTVRMSIDSAVVDFTATAYDGRLEYRSFEGDKTTIYLRNVRDMVLQEKAVAA